MTRYQFANVLVKQKEAAHTILSVKTMIDIQQWEQKVQTNRAETARPSERPLVFVQSEGK